jgi:hypothetical protein
MAKSAAAGGQSTQHDLSVALDRVADRIFGIHAIYVARGNGDELVRTSRAALAVPPQLRPLPVHLKDKIQLRSATEDPYLAGTFAYCSDQAMKIKLGKMKSLTCQYGDKVVVHVNCDPCVVTFEGSLDMNVGMIIDSAEELDHALSSVSGTVSAAP